MCVYICIHWTYFSYVYSITYYFRMTFILLPDTQAEITTVTDEACRVAYGAMAIEDSMMCAGLPNEEADTCYGDEGGPLLCLGNLHGVTSWGMGCGQPDYPRVFSEVAYYKKWIMMYIST